MKKLLNETFPQNDGYYRNINDMIRAFLFSFFVLVMQFANAQIENPVQWSFSSKKINATTYQVHLTATIEDGWHIYSQTTPDGGPVPTAVSFSKNPLLKIEGKTVEVGKMEKRFEELFGVEVKQYSDKIDFVQTVKLKASAKTTINGSVEFMACNEKECIPPKTQKFSIALK